MMTNYKPQKQQWNQHKNKKLRTSNQRLAAPATTAVKYAQNTHRRMRMRLIAGTLQRTINSQTDCQTSKSLLPQSERISNQSGAHTHTQQQMHVWVVQ